MSKKNKVPKHGPIIIDAAIVWNAQKPQYNAWNYGHGVHGKNKYSRKEKHKTNWRFYG